MGQLKKTILLFLLLISKDLLAGTMGPVCIPGSVTIPCPQSAWVFAGQALYLKPNFSQIGYYGSETTSRDSHFLRVNYKWGWGYKLEGAYYFSTGNDINLNWYHYSRSTNENLPNGVVTRFGETINTQAVASIQPKWDAVNLEWGQWIDLTEVSKLRLYGGGQFARILAQGGFSGVGATIVDPLTGDSSIDGRAFTVRNSTAFNGAGPRIGADLSYIWGYGLAFYGKTAAAILVGTSSFNRSVSNNIFTPIGLSGTQSSVAPALDLKLGASYAYPLSQGVLTADIGWLWLTYFNVVRERATSTIPIVSDFGLQGLYFGLKWVGNAL